MTFCVVTISSYGS